MKISQKPISAAGAEKSTSLRADSPASRLVTQVNGGGREDDRYLWPEMLRAIDEIRPAWVVGENVAGLATMVEGWLCTEMGGGATLFEEDSHVHDWIVEQAYTIEEISKGLEGLGYSVQPVLIPAAAVNAPHKRERIFILAYADTDGQGRKEPQQPGRGKDQEETGAGIHHRAERPGTDGLASDTNVARIKSQRVGEDKICESFDSSDTDGGRSGKIPTEIHTRLADGDIALRDGCERDATNAKSKQRQRLEPSKPKNDPGKEESGGRGGSLYPGERWEYTEIGEYSPTFSPVHRGNDGLPFSLDDLTISPVKWRTESLKAYGNAIVPQVMYRIFQAIEQAQKHTQNDTRRKSEGLR